MDETIQDAQRSLSNESIAKFLAHECDCGKDCCKFITRNDTFRWRAATYDFVQHGQVADHALNLLDAVKVANPNTRKDLKNNSKVFIYKLEGLAVCDEVFRLAHGLSKTAITRGQQLLSRTSNVSPKKRSQDKQ